MLNRTFFHHFEFLVLIFLIFAGQKTCPFAWPGDFVYHSFSHYHLKTARCFSIFFSKSTIFAQTCILLFHGYRQFLFATLISNSASFLKSPIFIAHSCSFTWCGNSSHSDANRKRPTSIDLFWILLGHFASIKIATRPLCKSLIFEF